MRACVPLFVYLYVYIYGDYSNVIRIPKNISENYNM